MLQEQIKKILAQLADHDKRLERLEGTFQKNQTPLIIGKQRTLNEIIRGKSFESGQQKVAAIIGYQEKILVQAPVKGSNIRGIWKKCKFDGKYRSVFVKRAVKDGLVRDLENGTYDLSTGGDVFFEKLLNNESANSTSK